MNPRFEPQELHPSRDLSRWIPLRLRGTEAERGPERARSGLRSGFRYLTGVAGGWWDRWMVMGSRGSQAREGPRRPVPARRALLWPRELRKYFLLQQRLAGDQVACFLMHLLLNLKLTMVEDADSEYILFAVVVHVGSGPNHGDYVSLIKSQNHWLMFDDDTIAMIDESTVQTFFGSSLEYPGNTDHGYILFYESWWKELLS
ncbi:hypothetical protein B296_00047274 [Ensete ventricosum]|uniref:ubiquitinyl hydrolase 1 n=1 Tax=Ensete ventricosum TaxID=4639 RepID=A0A426Z0C1_ENSVE|nr:hypothetical protein B296_00047274 [Ensete ventricosum]